MSADETSRIRLHQLEGFYHVCRHKGFAAAVQALPYSITEPALHQQVRKLEQSLGVRLLVQGPKRTMIPTPEGRTLYTFVENYFEQLPHVLRGLTEGTGGTIALGVEPLYLESLCAEAVKRFRSQHPDVTVRLAERDGLQIAEAVEAGSLDLGVASYQSTLPPRVVFEPLGRLGLFLVTPPDHPLTRRRKPIDFDELREYSYVLYEPGIAARNYTDAVLEHLGFDLSVAAEASSALGLRALVRTGIAPAFVPSLQRQGKKAHRRRSVAGVTEFDITDLVAEIVKLPEFGFLRRNTTLRHRHAEGLEAEIRRGL